jgi:hypothetical protein
MRFSILVNGICHPPPIILTTSDISFIYIISYHLSTTNFLYKMLLEVVEESRGCQSVREMFSYGGGELEAEI